MKKRLLLVLAGVLAINLNAEMSWTTGEGAPGDWTPLADNLIANQTPTTTGNISGYGGNASLLTDGAVSGVTKQTCGLGNGATASWTFAVPKTIEKIRVTSCDITDGRNYDNIKVSDIQVKTTSSDEWTSLGCGALNYEGSNAQGIMIYAILEDAANGCLADQVTALRFVSGTPNNVAQYYAEIEAVGHSSASGPVVDSFAITPAKTKAKVVGTIVEPGTDATACDIYLSIDSEASVKIAEGVTGAFAYQITGLTAETEYAYELIVSNNAQTARATVMDGVFTTLAESAPTVVWSSGLYSPNDWDALENNVLANLKGTMAVGTPNSYGTNDLVVLSDGIVPSVGGKNWIIGLANNAEIDWTFAKPMAIERLRFSSAYLEDPTFSGVNIASVKVKTLDSDEWVEIPGSSSGRVAGDGTSKIVCATLSDTESGYVSREVVALKVVFGPAVNVNANYYVEIEATGFAEATGPIVDALTVTPAKTKAIIEGSISDAGTDATMCDVYLSLNGAPAVRIAKKVTASFEYQLTDLTAGSAYTYELSFRNNAASQKTTVRSGDFTTVASEAVSASWSVSDYTTGAWSPAERNLLAGLEPSASTSVSPYASKEVASLTDGVVPTESIGSTVVGFMDNGTIAWTFNDPKTIGSLRISSLWEGRLYNGISISTIEVCYPSDSSSWVALDLPTISWTGGSADGQCAVLTDPEFGYLAKDVVGLRLTFGPQKAAVANYYAEIEALPPRKFFRDSGMVIIFK